MSLLSRRVLETKAAPTPQSYAATGGVPQYQLINGRLVTIADNRENYLRKGYDINDIVYSIINLITDKCRLAPWGIYKVVDESAYKQLKAVQSKKKWNAADYSLATKYQKKALETVNNTGKWGELLKYPNRQETFSDFVANGIGYKLLTGNNFIWGAPLGNGSVNKGIPNELWLLPAQYVNIKANVDRFPVVVTGYEIQGWPGVGYATNEILHEKYWNPNWTIQGEQLYGISPLRAGLGLINRNNSSMTAAISAFQNEGIKGILHLKAQIGQVGDGESDMLIDEINRLKETLVNEWSGPRNKGRIGIGGYDMGWLPVGQNSEEMQIIETEKWDMRRICNLYGVQSQLLNDPDNKTYANQEEAEKALTTRAAMPHLCAKRDSLNRHATEHWGLPKGWIIDFDSTVFSELQQDAKDMMAWLTPLMDRGLPLNRVLELINLERVDDPYYDMPRVTTTMGQTIEEHNLNDVENALNDDDEEDIPDAP